MWPGLCVEFWWKTGLPQGTLWPVDRVGKSGQANPPVDAGEVGGKVYKQLKLKLKVEPNPISVLRACVSLGVLLHGSVGGETCLVHAGIWVAA